MKPKTKSYKAIAGIVTTALSTLLLQPVDMNPWFRAAIVSVVAGLSVWVTPNPEKEG